MLAKGDQNQDCDYTQVIPSAVIIGTCVCYIVKFFPEGNKSLPVLFALYNCTGLDRGMTNITNKLTFKIEQCEQRVPDAL